MYGTKYVCMGYVRRPTHARTPECMYVCMYVSVYVCVYIYVCVVYVCTCMYVIYYVCMYCMYDHIVFSLRSYRQIYSDLIQQLISECGKE
jgi:hypothetical protein